MELKKENMNQIEGAIAKRERAQFKKMTESPIARLIIGLGIPTTLSMMVTSLYNLADTYFVSLLKNDAITAAASNVLALMSIIQAIGFTFGMGSGALISRLLGNKDREGADKVFSSSMFISCVCGLLVSILGFTFFEPMLRLLGSKATDVLEYSKQYAVWLLIAAPFMCMSFVLNNVLRAEGKAVLSMVGLVVGAVVNVALDPLLIFSAGLGIRGAAIATCISQLLSFAVLMFMFLSGKTIIRFRLRSISKKFDVYSEVITTGFPSFCRQVLASLCTVFLNGAAFDCGVAYYGTEDGGKAAQAALGVVQKVFMLAFSMALGIGQGYQPVLGYNYSAQRYDRVKSAYLFTLTFSTCVMAVFGIVCGIFSSTVMDLFSLSAEAKNIGSLALRLQCICMPLLPLNFMASVTYQSLGKKTIASILSVSRQGLFYIPAVLIMPRVMGLLGVQSCQALSDLLAFFFAIPFTIMFFNMIKREKTALNEQLLEKANI